MKRLFSFAAMALGAALATPSASAADKVDHAFFEKISGDWTGPGEIIAGKYKGTRFACNLTGASSTTKIGLTLDGGCRVGPFLQKMNGKIEKGVRGFKGSFLDGAEGKGLDILSGNMVGDDKIVLEINRKQLNGLMQARLTDEGTLTVTVSVQVENNLVPVIGMNLKHVDSVEVGSISK